MTLYVFCFFFFQAEDGIRDLYVTGVQTCTLPISCGNSAVPKRFPVARSELSGTAEFPQGTLSHGFSDELRSEERRVGKECRSRRAPYKQREKMQQKQS